MQLALIPYAELDGVRTMTDSFVMSLWDEMDRLGLAGRAVFFDGSVQDAWEFLREMKSPEVSMYVLRVGNDIGGVIWLNCQTMRTAHFHFCGFPAAWKTGALHGGLFALQTLLGQTGRSGEYLLDTLFGLLPTTNTLALRMMRRAGFVDLGPVPNGVYLHREGRSVPAIMSYCDRDTLGRQGDGRR